jgi:hypothetical protein
MLRAYVALASIVALSVFGCANTPPRDAPKFQEALPAPEGLATLYVFRPFAQIGSGVWPVTFFNDRKVFDLKLMSYTVMYLAPGTYRIRTERSWALSGMGDVPGGFTIPSVGTYYLAFITQGSDFRVPSGKTSVGVSYLNYQGWRLVSRDEAMQALPKMQYITPEIQQITR